MEMTSVGPEFFFFLGGGQIGVDGRTKNPDFDCIMKAFCIKRNNTGNRWGRMESDESGTGTRSGTSELK